MTNFFRWLIISNIEVGGLIMAKDNHENSYLKLRSNVGRDSKFE
jgi:hypothetical protein